MCVRYTLHKSDAAIAAVARALRARLVAPEWAKPRYNVALTHVVPVVARAGAADPEVRPMLWGFMPGFERGRPRSRMFPNARSESASAGAAFRGAVSARRCLVPANGFYEWSPAGRGAPKQPFLFTVRGEEAFAFAGIWEPGGPDEPATFAILTTAPNERVAPVHDRMPVVLTGETMPRWIGSEPLADAEYRELVRPLAAERMDSRAVNAYVNSVRNEGPRCLDPPDPPEPELDLELGDFSS